LSGPAPRWYSQDMDEGREGRSPRPQATLGLLATASVAQFLASSPVWAYLDPGTGSYLFQLVTAALVGGLFALKVFWGRITKFLRRSDRPPRNPGP
jgi:hypothetical protein